jgi:hypothetical protein
MKRYFVIYFVILLGISFFSQSVFAQNSDDARREINARILPTVWYSTLSINEGDSVKIYAAIQNNSGLDFTGTAIFFVDNIELSKNSFSSNADSLRELSSDWVADPGTHNVQVKVSAALPAGKVLVSNETDKSSVTITKKIVPVDIKETVNNTVSTIITKTDYVTNVIADKIETYKRPEGSVNSNTRSDQAKNNTTNFLVTSVAPKVGEVLGISTTTISGVSDVKIKDSIFNRAIDAISFLLRHWLWIIGVIVFLYIARRVKRWGDR